MLSQAAGYAATALGFVASAGGRPVLVKEIAEASGIPGSYLAKIIHSLARKGVVFTQRGIGGGVTLAKPATGITLMDICIALDDPVVEKRCMLGTSECSDERACPAHKYWTMQRDKHLEFLRGTSVADIAAFELRRRNAKVAGVNPAMMGGIGALGGTMLTVNGSGASEKTRQITL
ncbi:MAG: Rrf2 family transcriptional regulator [Planctomycetota bacterium]|nr:Rrf2 family transcriptional regulator [Planctomycetota bacterium]